MLGQRVSSPTETIGWVRSPRIPENKRVKNTPVGDYHSVMEQEEEKCSQRGEEMRNTRKR